VLENRQLREEMGDAAQQYALTVHSMRNAEKVVEILDG
jgi:hypothetical protein